ncbi:Oxo-4-hydroxy-4-carboxy-5-ureidoimidazoline decarboxylase [Phytophthora cactorum]|nr:Oxo-4-hydroxy-4-carboxy-5-ureidoimidazoline decarboxylase [Phytophthora cactorum]
MDLSVLNVAAAAPGAEEEGSPFPVGGRNGQEVPLRDFEELCRAADTVDAMLTCEDWLEAFAAHPRIGRAKKPIKEWEAQEQQVVTATKNADDAVLDRLEELNDAYYKKFGYIYIVCATGKSAPEMLRILESRMDNSPEGELAVAAGEQSKITKIRLEKLLQE